MFVTRDGRLLVNELAPRPHNSGHWTIDACAVSQFEQLVRAVCGLPLGAPEPFADAVMDNLLGAAIERLAATSGRARGSGAPVRQARGQTRPQARSRDPTGVAWKVNIDCVLCEFGFTARQCGSGSQTRQSRRAGPWARARPFAGDGMEIRDQELLARLRTLGSKAGAARTVGAVTADTEDALGLLGLPEQELTPSVRSALGDLIEEVAELRKELVTTQVRLAELERLADEDSLAPISNRRAFLRSLARTVGYVERYGAACSLLYFDVNGLKSINDTRGHAAGDAALIHIAAVCARTSGPRTSSAVWAATSSGCC